MHAKKRAPSPVRVRAEGAAPAGRPHPGPSGPGANGIGGQRPIGRGHPEGHRQVADVQRARMLTATVQEVAERGVANVSVAHIVARSGVSRRTFYEIFEDREDCYLAAFDEAIERFTAVIVSAYLKQTEWRGSVRAALVALLEQLECDRARGRLLIVESLAAGPRALERRRHVLSQILPILDLGRNEGKQGSDPPPLTAEGVLGGVLSVLHARLTVSPPTPVMRAPHGKDPEGGSLVPERGLIGLAGPLMGMIVLPYLGPAAARREIERPAPKRAVKRPVAREDPLQGLPMRLTYRTMRVLTAVARQPCSSNRHIGDTAEIGDQGQVSKLLARLQRLGLIENKGIGAATRGEPNAWTLTATGRQVHDSIAGLGAGAS